MQSYLAYSRVSNNLGVVEGSRLLRVGKIGGGNRQGKNLIEQAAMKPLALSTGIAALLLVSAACSQQQEQHAKQQAEEANRKSDAALHKLSTEAKQDAHKLKQELQRGMNGSTNSTSEAGRKLDHAGHVARDEATVAGQKLDHATIIARVKAKLASDVGLATVSGVRVDAAGDTVTLSGTVASEDQKRLAGQAASQVSGVAHVNNDIRVQP